MKRLFYTDEKVDNRFFQRRIGFQPSYGWMLVSDEKMSVFLDGRYIEKEFQDSSNRKQADKVLLEKKFTDTLKDYIEAGEEVVLEKSMPYAVVEALQKSDLEVQRIFDEEHRQRSLRIQKSEEEKEAIKVAIHKTHEIWTWLEDLATQGKLHGRTELEVRGLIVQKAYSLGLEGEAFDTIVATGAHTAIPHHQTGRVVISDGPLLVDMGFRWKGYCSDFTRTIWVGKKNDMYEEFEKVLKTVRLAHDFALQSVEIGMTCADLAKKARNIIAGEGYGDYFTHSLGHGVGLDIHEAPYVSIKSEDTIAPGMIFTIEPGVYLPGKFGVRWENIVIVE